MIYNSILIQSDISFEKNNMKNYEFFINYLRRRSHLLIYPICHPYDDENYDYANYYWGKDIYQKN